MNGSTSSGRVLHLTRISRGVISLKSLFTDYARVEARLQTYLACVPAGSAIIDGADTSVCCQPVICS